MCESKYPRVGPPFGNERERVTDVFTAGRLLNINATSVPRSKRKKCPAGRLVKRQPRLGSTQTLSSPSLVDSPGRKDW